MAKYPANGGEGLPKLVCLMVSSIQAPIPLCPVILWSWMSRRPAIHRALWSADSRAKTARVITPITAALWRPAIQCISRQLPANTELRIKGHNSRHCAVLPAAHVGDMCLSMAPVMTIPPFWVGLSGKQTT